MASRLSGAPELAAALPFDAELGAEIARRLEPFEPSIDEGVYSDEAIDIAVGAFTGEAARVLDAEISKQTFAARMPFDRSLNSSGLDDDARSAVNWFTTWRQAGSLVEVWLCRPSDDLLDALAAVAPDGRLRVFDWPDRPRLSVPELLVEALFSS